MQIISLDEIKQNARVENTAEDTLIAMYGDAAEEAVLNLCNRDIDDLVSEYGKVPTSIKYACIMLATHFYEHRTPAESINLSAVPYTFDTIVKPYMRLSHV